MFSTIDIFDIAIQIEKNGQTIYEIAASRSSDVSLASILNWMSEEEKNHAEKFHRMKNKVTKMDVDPETAKMGRMLLQEVLKENTFSLDSEQLSTAYNVREVLEISLEFEKDTILFYKMLGTFIDDQEVTHHLHDIIQEERQHVKKIEELLELNKKDGNDERN